MRPERSPDVLIAETPRAQHAIHLRSQAHAVFIGPTRSGPVGIPVRVTSVGEATRRFMSGPPLQFSDEIAPSRDHMALAATLFFENGGDALTIVRAAHADAVHATGSVAGDSGAALLATAAYPGRAAMRATFVFSAPALRTGPTAAEHLRVNVAVAERRGDTLLHGESIGPLSMVPVAGVRSLRDALGGAHRTDSTAHQSPITLALPPSDDDVLALFRRALALPSDSPLEAVVGKSLTIDLGGGSDGTRPAVSDYLGTGARIGGLDALADVHDIGLLAAPGVTDLFRRASDVLAVQQAMLTFVERRGYGFVLLSGARGADVAAVQAHRRAFSSSFGALYTPWVEMPDGQWTSPCGAVAGCIARRDRESGVTAAPAGLDVRGVRSVSDAFDASERATLTASNVNVIGELPGRGIRLQSARTLSPLVDWRFIPVRRFLGAVAQAVAQDLTWAVFEPNDDALWARVRSALSEFCLRCWREGMLVGATPAEAFYVHCDRTTMTEQDISDGRLHALVGVAALRPSEFHVIRQTLIVQPPAPAT